MYRIRYPTQHTQRLSGEMYDKQSNVFVKGRESVGGNAVRRALVPTESPGIGVRRELVSINSSLIGVRRALVSTNSPLIASSLENPQWFFFDHKYFYKLSNAECKGVVRLVSMGTIMGVVYKPGLYSTPVTSSSTRLECSYKL